MQEKIIYRYGIDNIFDWWFMKAFTTIPVWKEERNDISYLKYEDKDYFYCYSEDVAYNEEKLFEKFNIIKVT